MSKVKRERTSKFAGIERRNLLSDENLVAEFLLGDTRSIGDTEDVVAALRLIAHNTAEILLTIDRQKVLDICEDK